MRKRIICSFTIIVLVCGLLFGCGTRKASPEPTGQSILSPTDEITKPAETNPSDTAVPITEPAETESATESGETEIADEPITKPTEAESAVKPETKSAETKPTAESAESAGAKPTTEPTEPAETNPDAAPSQRPNEKDPAETVRPEPEDNSNKLGDF